jgi:hypothetical protein
VSTGLCFLLETPRNNPYLFLVCDSLIPLPLLCVSTVRTLAFMGPLGKSRIISSLDHNHIGKDPFFQKDQAHRCWDFAISLGQRSTPPYKNLTIPSVILATWKWRWRGSTQAKKKFMRPHRNRKKLGEVVAPFIPAR